MATSEDLSVARADFVNSVVQPDRGVPNVSREDATLFAKTLLKTCNICTSSNVQFCKIFIVKNILLSSSRVAALGKYLVTLSKSYLPRDTDKRIDTTKPGDENEGLGKIVKGRVQQPPEPAFKRLHILYVIHDVLAYISIHYTDPEDLDHYDPHTFRDALDQLWPAICALADLAACHSNSKYAQTGAIIKDMIETWDTMCLFSPVQIGYLRDRIPLAEKSDFDSLVNKVSTTGGIAEHDEEVRKQEQAAWITPTYHSVIGDDKAPWHELPAANGLYMMRTRGYPLQARAFPPKGYEPEDQGFEADAELKKEVLDIYNDVIRCYDKYTNLDEVQDIDALGNIIWKDPERPTRNYWGFRLDQIDKRKELARQFADSAEGYSEFGPLRGHGRPVNQDVDRARALAVESGRGNDLGRGMAYSGYRGGGRR